MSSQPPVPSKSPPPPHPPQPPFYTLPNELLLSILSLLPTLELLPLTTTSTRLSSIILRILRTRLLLAASLPSHKLLLECYPPAQKLTAPPLYCTYLGTPGLDDEVASERSKDHPKGTEKEQSKECAHALELRHLKDLTSRFHPQHVPITSPSKHPAGDIPGSRTHPSSSSAKSITDTSIRQLLTLDSHERFTQLCTTVNLVKLGPRSGLFQCFIDVEDGFVRVFRDWLAEVAQRQLARHKLPSSEQDDNCPKPAPNHEHENDLYVGPSHTIGFRLHVTRKQIPRQGQQRPILELADEDEAPVCYELEYQELLVRTTQLLLALERSFVQQESYSRKAMVWGNFG